MLIPSLFQSCLTPLFDNNGVVCNLELHFDLVRAPTLSDSTVLPEPFVDAFLDGVASLWMHGNNSCTGFQLVLHTLHVDEMTDYAYDPILDVEPLTHLTSAGGALYGLHSMDVLDCNSCPNVFYWDAEKHCSLPSGCDCVALCEIPIGNFALHDLVLDRTKAASLDDLGLEALTVHVMDRRQVRVCVVLDGQSYCATYAGA